MIFHVFFDHCMWILYIIPPHLRALSELITLLGTITSTPFFKGTFESMILRTSRFGWGYVFGLPWRVISLGVVSPTEPWSKAPPSDKLGISPCWSDPCNDTGKRRRRRWRDRELFSKWSAFSSGRLWWKICLSKKLWNINGLKKWWNAIWEYTVGVYADPFGQLRIKQSTLWDVNIMSKPGPSATDQTLPIRKLQWLNANNVFIISWSSCAAMHDVFAHILWCVLLKEENFFAMVRSRPKRPRHEKVPKTEAEPKIGADEGQGSGLDEVAIRL